jgi:hypothetical protein
MNSPKLPKLVPASDLWLQNTETLQDGTSISRALYRSDGTFDVVVQRSQVSEVIQFPNIIFDVGRPSYRKNVFHPVFYPVGELVEWMKTRFVVGVYSVVVVSAHNLKRYELNSPIGSMSGIGC